MSHKYSCFICGKQVTRSNKPKHLFSSAHTQDLYNEILKKKERFSVWIQSVEEGNPVVIPSIYYAKTTLARGYKICYACKTLQETPIAFSTCSCGGVVQNAAIIKDILETKTFIANPEYQKSVAVETKTADTQTEGGEIEKLQKEITRLKKRLEINESILEEAPDMDDGLFNVLQLIQDDSLDKFIDAMKILKTDYPLAYERQKSNFGTEWDDSVID